MADLCHLVNQWFIAALGFCGTIQGNVLNWLVLVVDSVQGGSKNGSFLPVLPCGFVGLCRGKLFSGLGTIERNVLNWLVIVVDSEKGGSKNGSSRPVRKMADFCHLVNQWFIAALGFCGTLERNVLNWLVIVVDSEKGGSKNGSSLPVLPCGFVGLCRGKLFSGLGTIERNVLNWLVIVVDSEKGGSKNGSSRPVRKMADLCHLVNQWFLAGLRLYQSYSRLPANMPFATRRLDRLHRHCLENSGWGKRYISGAAKLSWAPIIGARWLGHCVAGAE